MKKFVKAAAGGLLILGVGAQVMAGPVKSPVERYVIEAAESQVGVDASECRRVVLPNRTRPPFKRDEACNAQPNLVQVAPKAAERALSR
jgi:hypothetical protein